VEVTGRRGWRLKQILYDLNERTLEIERGIPRPYSAENSLWKSMDLS